MAITTHLDKETEDAPGAGPLRRLAAAATQEARAYQGDGHEAGHLGAAATYAVAVLAAATLARAQGRAVPTVSPWDAARLAVATFKGSRLLAKNSVTGPLRAPFTRRVGDGKAGEVQDEPRGDGARHTVGELLSCPFCLGQWVATGLAVGLVFTPATTRLVASTLTAVAGADFLHHAYTVTQQRTG